MKTLLIGLLSGLLLAVMIRLLEPVDDQKPMASDKKTVATPESTPGNHRKFLGVAVDAAIAKVVEDVIDLLKKAVTDKLSLVLVGAISTGVYFSALTLEQIMLASIAVCLLGLLWIVFLVYEILRDFKQQQTL